jgi:hypothetical protein
LFFGYDAPFEAIGEKLVGNVIVHRESLDDNNASRQKQSGILE